MKALFHSHSHDNLNKSATYASVTAAILIALMKVIGWSYTNSLSILASLADTSLDLITSLINLIAVHYALQPPDNEHRFGHNKAEDLAVFMQSSFFAISGILLFFVGVKRFFFPEEIHATATGITVMFCSMLITLALVGFQRMVIKKTKSSVIEADHLHYKVDLLSCLVVILAILTEHYFKFKFIDPLFSCLISFYILYSASKMITRSFNNLMDHELAIEEKTKIIKLINRHPAVKGYHDLKTRHAGSKAFIQFHIELEKTMTLEAAHDIVMELEERIFHLFPHAEIIIHTDPEGVEEHISYHA